MSWDLVFNDTSPPKPCQLQQKDGERAKREHVARETFLKNGAREAHLRGYTRNASFPQPARIAISSPEQDPDPMFWCASKIQKQRTVDVRSNLAIYAPGLLAEILRNFFQSGAPIEKA
ncbi:hypothetical protein PM082_003140 [Marasmius tenuissimus]|nr:hypothetical protein PM082_003140 [Marasmius tenuissimus]